MRKRRRLSVAIPLQAYQAFDIPTFAVLHNVGESKIWEDIRKGKLKARKAGTRTLITAEDGAAWREQLPMRTRATSD